MLRARTWSVRGRVDRVAAWAIVVVMVGSFAPAMLTAYGRWDATTPPIFSASAEAPWVGLLALSLLALQVVLPARLPWREQGFGRAVVDTGADRRDVQFAR